MKNKNINIERIYVKDFVLRIYLFFSTTSDSSLRTRIYAD